MRKLTLLSALLAVSSTALAQTALPAAAVLTAELDHHVAMRRGQALHATLLYPVYNGTRLVLPSHTVANGRIVGFQVDRARRVRSVFNLDFTPYRIPVVQFTSLSLRTGEVIPIATDPASGGTPVVRFQAAPARPRGNLVHRELVAAGRLTRDTVLFFTGPGRGDRLLQLAYHQIPWHPQRIESETAWSFQTTSPVAVPAGAVTPGQADGVADAQLIEATLVSTFSSATARPGDPVQAVVATPIHAPDRNLTIPQGSVLSGSVAQCVPSRYFGRNGALRLSFNRITFPSGSQADITSDVTAVDANAAVRLAVDAEGKVRPQARDKVIVPALLVALAVAPLNPDPTDGDEFIKNGAASNSLGAPGFITGLAYNGATLSAAFGFYGAALSINDRWIRHGDDVVFPRNTRIVVHLDSRVSTLASETPPHP